MRHLDPELTTECLIYFLLNAKSLSESSKYILKLFDNIINQRYFQYLDDNLLFLLTEFILNFSNVIAKTLELETYSAASSTSKMAVTTPSEMISIAAFNRQQQLVSDLIFVVIRFKLNPKRRMNFDNDNATQSTSKLSMKYDKRNLKSFFIFFKIF